MLRTQPTRNALRAVGNITGTKSLKRSAFAPVVCFTKRVLCKEIVMDYTEALAESHFFKGITKNDIAKMITCLNAEYREYEKNEMILWEGSVSTTVGIVLSGRARSIKTDISGKLVIVTLLEQGSYISVLLAASHDRKSPVSVQASDHCSALFFPIERILGVCRNACPCHISLLCNILDAVAERALVLHDRNDCLIKPTVREKVLTYLTRVSAEKESRSFTIPLDRNAMAGYLNVDRSALSRELSCMKKDGLIGFHKNSFTLHV
jgi:CRP-like cAMP-binding protein